MIDFEQSEIFITDHAKETFIKAIINIYLKREAEKEKAESEAG